MLGLTTLGVFHTLISLIALVAGFASFVRFKCIRTQTPLGMTYLVTTAITAATGLGIFEHGGFGKPHVLSILTLMTLAVAYAAGKLHAFGSRSNFVEVIAYTLTMLFHFIPGVTETGTRFPRGAPLFANPDVVELKIIDGALFLLFLLVATIQYQWLKSETIRVPRASV
ncbi:hypothetical protein [Paraburkholderia caffeinilytica]|uniref:hypothetical protein n=1 Tax=Paraburkholderia caffeinilytica TaxID=1761016 RepID=UPI0038BCF55D